MRDRAAARGSVRSADMNDWDDETYYRGDDYREDAIDDPDRQTVRKFLVRVVAMLLLAGLLGSAFLGLRGIDHIGAVVAILAGAALVGYLAKAQRESEKPYEASDPQEYGPH